MSDNPRYRPPTQELMLLDLIQRLERLRSGRIAIHLHLSRLSRAYNRDQYLRIATDSFALYVSGFEGQLFPLECGDLFFVAKDATRTLLEAAVARIQQLFSQDPMIQPHSLQGDSGFCTWYVLTDDYDKLLGKVQELLRGAEIEREREASVFIPYKKPLEPIGPELLNRLEQALGNVDVSNIARRQTVCTLIDSNKPQPLFEEIFVSIDDLEKAVTPGVDLASNVWLFRYLTQTLDRRVMHMLIRDGVNSSRPFSVNLNVATVLAPEFAKFESVITPQLRGRLVIEMNKLDVFSDMGAFLFARDYLHDHGFRLCLDGLTHHTLPYYNRAKLGFDLVKLFWTPSGLDDMLPSQFPEVRGLVMDNGQAHTILCRCDDTRAVETGQDLGIVMFQGRYVDQLMERAKNAPSAPAKLRV